MTHTPPIAADDSSARRALVLAGGGMRVAYQAGVVKALYDAGLRFSHADGASGGTMNLAALMSGVAPDDLCERWRRIDVKKFVSLRPLHDYFRIADAPAMGDADGMLSHVYPTLGIDIGKICSARGINATFNVCRFDDKSLVAMPHTSLDIPRLVAAASLPILMPAVQANGSTWTDAAWIKDANLMACVENGANELWLVWCIGNTSKYRGGAFNQYVHMIEMSAAGALNGELQEIARINERIAQGETVFGHRSPIKLFVIKPQIPLPLDPDFFLNRIDAGTLIDMGYRDASHFLLHPQSAPLTPQATLMREPGVGVTYRLRLLGELNCASPSAFFAPNTNLIVHATIFIEDINAFLSSVTQQVDVTAHIDFSSEGMVTLITTGRATWATDTSVQWEFYFVMKHRRYRLQLTQSAAPRGMFSAWRRHSTLAARLYEDDTNTTPVGEGILRLSAREFIRALKSLHSTNAPTPQAGGRAVREFLGFCLKRFL